MGCRSPTRVPKRPLTFCAIGGGGAVSSFPHPTSEPEHYQARTHEATHSVLMVVRYLEPGRKRRRQRRTPARMLWLIAVGVTVALALLAIVR